MNQDLRLSIIYIVRYSMTTGIFDQKMFRPANQMYYFQLVPKLLTIRNQALAREAQSSNVQFRLKIVKGVQLCDQMKKSIGVRAVNGRAGFDKAQLNFNLPSFNPNRNIQFTLVLLKSGQGSEEQESGRFVISSNQYVNQFKNNKTRFYEQEVSLGENYSLRFNLFTDSSRFGLEKLIKQTNEEKKEQKRQNILEDLKKDPLNQPSLINQARSQMHSNSEKVEVISGEGRFMSPSRKIVRKQSDTRKMLRRQTSPTRSQDETSSKKGLKFLSRNTPREQTTLQKTQSLAEEEARKITEMIKEQEQKRQKILKEKQMQDIQRKIIQDKKRREEQLAKKAEQNRKAEQQQKIEAQRRKDLETRKAEQAKTRELKRLEAQKKQKQLEDAQRLAAEQRQKEIQRVKEDEQAAKKSEEARLLALKQQRIQNQKRRQQEKAKRFQQQRIQNAKRMAQQQEIQRKFEQEEEKRRIQLQQIKKKQEDETIKTKEVKNIRNDRKEQIKKQDTTKVTKKTSRQSVSRQKFVSIQSPKKTQQKEEDLRDSILVRVKTEESHQLEKYVFEAKPVVDSKKWSRPVNIKKTGSQLFDKKGNPVQSTQKVQTKGQVDTGARNKIILAIIIIIGIFFMYNVFTPKTKAKGRKRH